ACHAGGRGFESRPFRHLLKALSICSGLFCLLCSLLLLIQQKSSALIALFPLHTISHNFIR
ncbi:hypothetical protein, partial [Klebsiella pneumoniae]|uniref:hypothetical protein n=1 Tax=Klebsiella pneumoniae TaxID=573 RepID=UPI002739DC68